MSSEPDAPTGASPWHPVTPIAATPEAESTTDTDPGSDDNSSRHPELEERLRTISDTHHLTPTKPPHPVIGDSRQPVPTPIEADQAELVPAVPLPDAAETFPASVESPGHAGEYAVNERDGEAIAPTPDSPVSPYLAPFTAAAGALQVNPLAFEDDPLPTVTPSAHRKLAPSAAALLSVGELPDLDSGAPAFVPRYEPAPLEPDDGAAESDLFQEESPLAHTTVSVSDERAYSPLVPAPPSQPIPVVTAQVSQPVPEAITPPNPTSPEDDMPTAPESEPSGGPTVHPDDASAPPALRADGGADAPTEPPVKGGDGGSASGGGSAGGGDDGANSRSLWTSTPFLVMIGLIVMSGLGFAAYLLFLQPTSVPLPTETVVAAPPTPTLEPISPLDTTEFAATLPTKVGVYALTANTTMLAANPDSIPEGAELPDGVAEHHTLTYSDGTHTIMVDVWQHYDVAAAQATFKGLNIDSANPEPVLVDGQEAGTQVDVMSEAGPGVLWSNTTAVFSVNGPADQIHVFVDQFGY